MNWIKRRRRLLWASMIAANLLFLVTPLQALADGSPVTSGPGLAPIVITEVQPGSATSASEEFIELYNTTAQPIDLTAHQWQLEVASTTATNWTSPFRTVPLTGTIAPGQSYVVASQFTSSGVITKYLSNTASAWFSAGISAAAGHIRLTYSTNQVQSDGTCSAAVTVDDEVEWSAPKSGQPATPSLDGRSVFVTAKSTGIAPGSSLQRQTDQTAAHTYIDTDNDAVDLAVSLQPSPAALNVVSLATPPVNSAPVVLLPADGCDSNPVVTPDPTPPPSGGGTSTPPSTDPGATPPTGDTGGSNVPPDQSQLLPPQITELLPNPAAPQTDAHDEFIELYNPNAQPFDLKNYTLETGTTTLHDFSFTSDVTIPANSYQAIYSADSTLTLTNSGGQVRLLNATGQVLSQADAYPAADPGLAWAYAEGAWQWTTTPTPGAANIITQPVVAAPASSTKSPAASSKTKAKTTSTTAPTTKKAAVKGTSTTKTAAASKKSSGKSTSATNLANTASVTTPIHPAVLAAVAGLALLYGAYEYRTDVGNRLYQLRRYRSTRRETRGKP